MKCPHHPNHELSLLFTSSYCTLCEKTDDTTEKLYWWDLPYYVGMKVTNEMMVVSAILSARNKIDLRGSKLYVARVKPTGIGLSRPCLSCCQAARQYGIRRIVFTVDENEYSVLKV